MLVSISTRYVLRRLAHIIPICQTVHRPLFATVLLKEHGPYKGHSVTQLLEGKFFLALGITLSWPHLTMSLELQCPLSLDLYRSTKMGSHMRRDNVGRRYTLRMGMTLR